MRLGLWSIPQPADAAPVQPDLLVAPMLGFDSSGYRLGYGSGFYDRTLASLLPRPAAVGVAYAAARLASIRPLPHDIPMGLVITERGVEVRRSR